jgi:hypothetical protein
MQTVSVGNVLPGILFPFVQQWAERSGYTLLSRLLVDEQFRQLIEKYGGEIASRMSKAEHTPENNNGRRSKKEPAPDADPRVIETDAYADDLAKLQDRLSAMEAEQQMQKVLFEVVRAKIRPLALALGCCPECLVGVEGCSKCSGRSAVAYFSPDYKLLKTQIVSPLAACGVPLVLKEVNVSVTNCQLSDSTVTTRRSRPWPKR